jgi:hypothetical protein
VLKASKNGQRARVEGGGWRLEVEVERGFRWRLVEVR